MLLCGPAPGGACHRHRRCPAGPQYDVWLRRPGPGDLRRLRRHRPSACCSRSSASPFASARSWPAKTASQPGLLLGGRMEGWTEQMHRRPRQAPAAADGGREQLPVTPRWQCRGRCTLSPCHLVTLSKGGIAVAVALRAVWPGSKRSSGWGLVAVGQCSKARSRADVTRVSRNVRLIQTPSLADMRVCRRENL